MGTQRIYADFHNLDDLNRLRLNCTGTANDLARLGIELKEGARLTFCMDDANDSGGRDDLLVEGVTTYDREAGCWVAVVDWGAVRHASELAAEGSPNGISHPLKPHGPAAVGG